VFTTSFNRRCDHKNPVTADDYFYIYKKVLISLVEVVYSDIKDIISDEKFVQPIHDPATQQAVQQYFFNHIAAHRKSIIEPLMDKIPNYSNHGVIKVYYERDYEIVREHLSSAYIAAIITSLGEFVEATKKQIEVDRESLVELSKKLHKTPSDDIPKCIAEHCKNTNLLEKYFAIIFNMDYYGFNPDVFTDVMTYYSMNLSKTKKDIQLRYFTLVFRKDTQYNNKMKFIGEFIDSFITKMKSIKQHEQLIRDKSAEATRSKYSRWVN
jgi:hypothetical protein